MSTPACERRPSIAVLDLRAMGWTRLDPGIPDWTTNTMELQVEGMTCGHCVRAITDAIGRLGATARVDLPARTVEVERDIERDAAIRAIEDEGYRVNRTSP
jgi:copper chaperone